MMNRLFGLCPHGYSNEKELLECKDKMNNKEEWLECAEKDPNGLSQHAPGAKLDKGKTRPYLVYSGFSNALQEVWENGTFGANKYSDNGWKEVPNAHDRYMDAALRHLNQYMIGEIRDKDSNTHHLGAVAWNILAVLELELTKG